MSDFVRGSSAMDLRGYFTQLASNYDRLAGLDTPTQRFLADAPSLLNGHAPAGILIKGAGGKGMATYTPWVGLFDPDETSSPQRGIYVVYILAEDRSLLALTLNQGMEYLRQDHGDREARQMLAGEAVAIRAALPPQAVVGFSDAIDLRSNGARQRAYEAGNIACKMYTTATLPSEKDMRADLDSLMRLYEQAVAAKRDLLLTAPGTISSPVVPPRKAASNPLEWFRPKDDSDYLAVLAGQTQVKTRRHETLVTNYAAWAGERGFSASTPHPQDLVLVRDGSTTLIEVKVVYRGNTTEAVRAVVGQLSMYSHFLYPPSQAPRLLAVFSDNIGDAYVGYLAKLGIAAAWWDDGEWRGSAEAVSDGLAA